MGAGIPQTAPEQQLVLAPPFAGLQRRDQVTGLWGGSFQGDFSHLVTDASQAELRGWVQSLPASRMVSGWLLSLDFKRRFCEEEEIDGVDRTCV